MLSDLNRVDFHNVQEQVIYSNNLDLKQPKQLNSETKSK